MCWTPQRILLLVTQEPFKHYQSIFKYNENVTRKVGFGGNGDSLQNKQIIKFQRAVNTLKSGFRPRTDNIFKKDDNTLITDESEIITTKRELPNIQESISSHTITSYTADLATEDASLEEVKQAILKMTID